MKPPANYLDNERLQVNCSHEEHKQVKKSKLSSTLNIIWQYLLKIFPDKIELQVRQQSDRFDNTWWTVYDPLTGRSASFGSATDMLAWIEQSYYRR